MIGWICILNHGSPLYLGPSCLQMSPMKMVKQWHGTKEEQELVVVWSWMELGASQHCLKRRCGCARYFPPFVFDILQSFPVHFFQSSHLSFNPHDKPNFLSFLFHFRALTC